MAVYHLNMLLIRPSSVFWLGLAETEIWEQEICWGIMPVGGQRVGWGEGIRIETQLPSWEVQEEGRAHPSCPILRQEAGSLYSLLIAPSLASQGEGT